MCKTETNKSNIFPMQDILDITASVYAEKPQKAIHSFVGTYTRVCVCVCVSVCVSVAASVYVCVCVWPYTALWALTPGYVCVSVCVFVCLCVSVYIVSFICLFCKHEILK